MNIALVNPPFQEQYSKSSVRFVLNVIPPLGLGYLASSLIKHSHTVSITDFTVEKSFAQAVQNVVSTHPDVVGITASTPLFASAKQLAEAIKKKLPSAFFVLGGAHVSAVGKDALEDTCFDVGVLGEGEETVVELTYHLASNGVRDLSGIKGIIFRDGHGFVQTQPRAAIRDLDALPQPSRHLMPALRQYHPTPASFRKLPLGVMITSRGCPQQCTFCDRAIFGNAYRARSANNVLQEFDELVKKFGAREIRFFDDCFALDKTRVSEICSGLRKRKIPWTCLTTVGSVSKELLHEMKQSGCWQVLYGLESGDEKMLALLRKGATLEQNIRAVQWAHAAGLSVRADFIIGTPGETEESLKKTLDFALRMKLEYAHFNKFV
ncbi:MAG: radical SAM protein, partial [Candidatus Omnitrophica bacterium]|nr:radical SAM protein [Candidatus Omnitrophota bacterium]